MPEGKAARMPGKDVRDSVQAQVEAEDWSETVIFSEETREKGRKKSKRTSP